MGATRRGCGLFSIKHRVPRRTTAAVVFFLAAAVAFVLIADFGLRSSTLAVCGPVDGGPGVTTDKEDYQPNETVIITGCALDAYEGQNLTLTVTRPDGVVDSYIVAVSAGGFTHNYLLNGIIGTYTVQVLDGVNLLTSTTFTDHDTTTVAINAGDAATHSLSVTLTVAWSGPGGDPTQARFVNVTPSTAGCPANADPAWSAWMATSPPSPDTFAWTLAGVASDHGHRKICAQTAHGALGVPTGTLTADDTIWYTVANPALTETCGLDMVLVIDSSGSIDSTELAQMKQAFKDFVSAFLPETPTEMAIVEFDTSAAVTQTFTSSETDLNNAIDAAASGGATNWDDALYDAYTLFPHRLDKQDLIVFASDGNPNRRDGHVGAGHDGVVDIVTEQQAMDWATDHTDEAKTDDIRILALGIGSGLDVVNLKAISGNVEHPPAPIDENVDVITSDFSTLAADLSALAQELCPGDIFVHKIIDADGNPATTGDQTNGVGWTFSTNVDPPDSSTPASGDTDGTGMIHFAIDTGVDQTATVDVIEPGEPGYAFISASCTKQDGPDGDTDPDPVGTPASGAVNDLTVNKFDIINCTFYNTNLAMFDVAKNFSPDNPSSPDPDVTMALTCTSGTVTATDPTANEEAGDTANFTVTAFTDPGTTCTASEPAQPAGYTKDESACQNIAISTGGTSSCTITNILNVATFNVAKDFDPNHPSSPDPDVTMSLSCTSGSVTVTDATANEEAGDTANFTVSGFIHPGTTCTASEPVSPAGYTKDESACQTIPVSPGGTSSCTITNDLNVATFNVAKNFSPDHPSSPDPDVTMALSCTSGIVAATDPTANEEAGDTANFTVSGFTHPGTTCTATEPTTPVGYTKDESACVGVSISPGGTSSCTITNNLNTATFNVAKNFMPDHPSSPDPDVTMALSCTSGAVTATDPTANEEAGDTANFTVSGFTTPASCTATEPATPPGYTKDESACVAVAISPGGTSSCTITDNLNTATFNVAKNFAPDHPSSPDPDVTMSLACSSGIVSATDATANEEAGDTANFTVSGFTTPASCTATEPVTPAGYGKDESACATVPITVGGTSSCTITNTANTANFNVNKDFVPDHPASPDPDVTIALSCTSGTVTASDPTANEEAADSANFTVSGFTDPGTTCSATETVPAGYSADQSACQSVAITGGGTSSCTIVNTPVSGGTIVIMKDAVPNDPTDFDFDCGSLGAFSLDDDADGVLSHFKTFNDVPPGNYLCSEAGEPGWQTAISCSDPDGGTTTTGSAANIDLGLGETVTCTFTNTFQPAPPVGGIAGLLDAQPSPAHPEPAAGAGFAVWLLALAAGGVALAAASAFRLARPRRPAARDD